MLSPHLHELIQAVRSLEMQVVSSGERETIRVPGGAKEFPERLIKLQRALEAFDKAESQKAEDSYSYLLLATGAFISKAKKNGDRRSTYEIVNDAIDKYGEQAWAGGGKFDPTQLAKKHPLKAANPEMNLALDSAEAFKSKSLAKAQKDIQARAEATNEEGVIDSPPDPKI